MDATLLADLRIWAIIGLVASISTLRVAAQIEKTSGGQLLIETGDARHIMAKGWHWARIASLAAVSIWCIVFSSGWTNLLILAGAGALLFAPIPTFIKVKIFRRSRLLDVTAVVAAFIAWFGLLAMG